MPNFSASPIILFLWTLYATSIHAIVCGPKPDYTQGTASRIIPFSNADSNPYLAYDFQLNFTISTSLSAGEFALSASMDTGSTGVAIGAKTLNLSLEDVQHYPPGVESLSGGALWEGYWVPAEEVNMTFSAAGLTAKVPILAVTERSTCHRFRNGVCQKKTNVTEMPGDVNYVGQ